MPIEGLPAAEPAAQANTPDAGATNTAAQQSGAGAQPAQQTETPAEKTFTQAEVNAMIANRVKSGLKAELKKLTGDGEGGVTLETLQQQLNEERSARQALEARATVREFLTDTRNQLNVNPANVAVIEELVNGRLQFENGKPTNIKDAINAVKALAPALFTNQPGSVEAGEGRNTTARPTDMNAWIRSAHAKKAA